MNSRTSGHLATESATEDEDTDGEDTDTSDTDIDAYDDNDDEY